MSLSQEDRDFLRDEKSRATTLTLTREQAEWFLAMLSFDEPIVLSDTAKSIKKQIEEILK